ncbi:MAG: hypothetical protein U5K29_02560 [Acidimicrobiales bacterium]|nr:hypothetical protein [Acidimicrobiales bacterium]
MTLTLEVETDPTLPRLAWVAHLDRSRGVVTALVGPWVETAPDHLFEGAWAGDFGAMDFRRSYSFTGTGLIVDGNDAVVVAPAHTTECAFSRQIGDHWWFSNSLPLLLHASGGRLDLGYLDYEPEAHSVWRGLNRYRHEIPLAQGPPARRHYYRNLVVDPTGSWREEDKDHPPHLPTYEAYRRFLTETTLEVTANADSTERTTTYRPITFCSAGYDSSLCSLLARDAGALEAITFETSRSHRGDTGHEILRHLGYDTVHTVTDTEYRAYRDTELFLASGELGAGIFLNGISHHLRGTLAFAGYNGDNVWSRDASPTRELRRAPLPITNQNEFRIHTGFLSFCPSFLTAAVQPDIVEISNSTEMEPWSLGGDYDRPIPRRMLEERGLPRDSFGMHKPGGAGNTLRFGTLRYLSKVMNPQDHAEFSAWVRGRVRRHASARWVVRSAGYLTYVTLVLLAKRGITAPKRAFERHLDPAWTCSPFAPRFLFPWAVEKLQETAYRDIDLDFLNGTGEG